MKTDKPTIKYVFLDVKPFFEFFRTVNESMFESDFDFDVIKVLSDEENQNWKKNKQAFNEVKRYQLVAKVDDQIVGWSFGLQTSADDFYMVNSAVMPDYRRLGVYSELMSRVLEHINELGFQRIYSKHKMANNAILIPKLKAGFMITGFLVDDVFGTLVELSYYTNSKRRELLEIRMGTRKMDAQTAKLVK